MYNSFWSAFSHSRLDPCTRSGDTSKWAGGRYTESLHLKHLDGRTTSFCQLEGPGHHQGPVADSQFRFILIKLPIRKSMVSQNENQKAVVQELDSCADAAQKSQWHLPVQQKEVRGAGRGVAADGRKLPRNVYSRTLSVPSPLPT